MFHAPALWPVGTGAPAGATTGAADSGRRSRRGGDPGQLGDRHTHQLAAQSRVALCVASSMVAIAGRVAHLGPRSGAITAKLSVALATSLPSPSTVRAWRWMIRFPPEVMVASACSLPLLDAAWKRV
jgi:hypothetical protein